MTLPTLDTIASLKILVVGDVMLDHYRTADATRISPEAPVPVLLNPTDEYRLGGAGAVAAMCRALGADVTLLSLIGPDEQGEIVHALAEAVGIHCRLSLFNDARQTTTKLRINGVASGRHRQQLLRIDTESTNPINDGQSFALTDCLSRMPGLDLVLVADYAKGIMTPDVARACIAHRLCIVDPPRGDGWGKYRHASCLVPNREEANGSTPLDLLVEYQLQAAVVKLDQDGCRLQDDVIPMIRAIRSRARVVHDCTGAGDQFLAVLGCARAAGASWFQAAELANVAAGLQVEKHGCTPVTPAELRSQCGSRGNR